MIKDRRLNFHIRQVVIFGVFSYLILSGCSQNPVKVESAVTQPPTVIASRTSTQTSTSTPVPSLTPTNTLTPTITPTLAPTLGIGARQIREADQMTMMYVPEGEFLMGSTDEELNIFLNSEYCKKSKCKKSNYLIEQPQHKVYLDAYWIDQTEVTNAMFARCVAAKACKPPAKFVDPNHPQWYGNKKFDQYPVVLITWQEAFNYCEWAGASLPSEAQWEKAARGTDGRIYPWGNDPDSTKANTCDKNCPALGGRDLSVDDGYAEVSPVGSYPQGASPYGVLDMSGNAFEYQNDWFSQTYYADSPVDNPTGPLTAVTPGPGLPSACKVVRGGAWDELFDDSVRTAYRRCSGPTGTYGCLGFRCAKMQENQ